MTIKHVRELSEKANEVVSLLFVGMVKADKGWLAAVRAATFWHGFIHVERGDSVLDISVQVHHLMERSATRIVVVLEDVKQLHLYMGGLMSYLIRQNVAASAAVKLAYTGASCENRMANDSPAILPGLLVFSEVMSISRTNFLTIGAFPPEFIRKRLPGSLHRISRREEELWNILRSSAGVQLRDLDTLLQEAAQPLGRPVTPQEGIEGNDDVRS
jgi:hypothetical protein